MICPRCEREATIVLGSCSECGRSVTGRPSLIEQQVRKAQRRSYPTWRLRRWLRFSR